MTEIKISTPFIKLDQFLKFSGVALSGGEAKEMVAAEIVKVNEEICTARGKKLVAGDKITVMAKDGNFNFKII